jgi:hypothetical protein
MKERPILFSGPMVRALLAGTKTQTRRAFSPRMEKLMRAAAAMGEVSHFLDEGSMQPNDLDYVRSFFPYGQPGDRLWVRETHNTHGGLATYRADGDWIADYHREEPQQPRLRWVPAIHMPRAVSRITLEITGVRVERLQDISDPDALAEGCSHDDMRHGDRLASVYARLWEDINGPGAWAQNPWVWVVEFERAQAQQKGPQQ